jgi:hypothetical protein
MQGSLLTARFIKANMKMRFIGEKQKHTLKEDWEWAA